MATATKTTAAQAVEKTTAALEAADRRLSTVRTKIKSAERQLAGEVNAHAEISARREGVLASYAASRTKETSVALDAADAEAGRASREMEASRILLSNLREEERVALEARARLDRRADMAQLYALAARHRELTERVVELFRPVFTTAREILDVETRISLLSGRFDFSFPPTRPMVGRLAYEMFGEESYVVTRYVGETWPSSVGDGATKVLDVEYGTRQVRQATGVDLDELVK